MVWFEFFGLLLIIVFAAYLLSRGGEVLAAKWGFNIVGSIVLALLTTLPEYSFVYWACVKTEYQMAIGSAIGACTILVTLGYGLVILLATCKLSRNPVKAIQLSKATRIDAFYLLGTAIVAFILIYIDDRLSVIDGIILTLIFFAYIYNVVRAEKSLLEGEPVTKKELVRAFIELIIGGAIVFLASERFVDSMISVSNILHVPPVLIAVVLGPIASEMPEKLTAYIVVLKNGANAELSICNFIGSKVNHNSLLLAVIPFVAAIHGHGDVTGLKSPMFMVMTILTVFVGVFLMRGRLERWQGAVLSFCYVAAMVLAVLTNKAPIMGH
jgi:cation:H+ antiporter